MKHGGGMARQNRASAAVATDITRQLRTAEAEIDRLRAELAAAQTWHMQYVGESSAEYNALADVIARVRAVITDHDCCNCLVRADGCEHMWNEMREVFRPALDGGTE